MQYSKVDQGVKFVNLRDKETIHEGNDVITVFMCQFYDGLTGTVIYCVLLLFC